MLNDDVSRCAGLAAATCGKRWICARYIDGPSCKQSVVSYADLGLEAKGTNGECRFFIRAIED